jgi:tripartite-type tricarboxylate transporter receptor subunit TctC
MKIKVIGMVQAISCLALGCILFNPQRAVAVDYPDKKITYIVSYAVGGKADLMARAIAPFVQERLGVQIQIENYPGTVKIGLSKLWRAKPDGYTIGGFALPSPVLAELASNTDYRSKEFSYIYAWNASSLILQVQANGPKDVAELVKLAKTRPLSGATGAFGSGPHLASIVMAKGLGIEARWVHYNSGGEANVALAGGHVDFNMVSITPQTLSLVQAGKVRPLMVVGDERDPAFPDTPTPRELGYSFATFPLLEGAVAPKNLPPDRLMRLENAFREAAKDPKFRKWADETKTQLVSLSSKAYSQKVAETYSEAEKYKDLLSREK